MNRKTLQRVGIMGFGMALSVLLLVILVEVLRVLPLGDVGQLSSQFWSNRPEDVGFGAKVLARMYYYLWLIGHVWLLLLVPVVGFLTTLLILNGADDEELQLYMERLHARDVELTYLRQKEGLASLRWDRTAHGFEELFGNSSESWLVLDGQLRIKRWNGASQALLQGLGALMDDWGGRKLADVWPGLVNSQLYTVLESAVGGTIYRGEVITGPQQDRRLQVWVWPYGEDIGLMLQDVSHLYRPENAYMNAEALARQLVEDSVRPVAVLDTEGRYLMNSRKWLELFALPQGMMLKGRLHAQLVPDFPENFSYAMQQLRHGQLVGKEDERRVINGQEERLTWHMRPWVDNLGRTGGYIFTVINNTELLTLRAQVKNATAREHALAYSDMLTGLPNRQLFNDRLNMALAQAHRQLGKVGLLFLDLDGFKAVNDKLGHEAGDLLLKQVAERLKVCIRQTDTVARLGGDEFTMILNIREREDTERVAEKILDVVRQPYDLNGMEARVGTSIGIAVYPQDGTQAADLIRMADGAMYAAKQAGKNTWRFHSAAQKTG